MEQNTVKVIADLHIHSRYSMATSKLGTPEYLDLWARKKGITLIGTGDFTHPAWREELKEKLIPAEEGLYRLKDEYVLEEARNLPGQAPRFVVTGEISSIYKKNGKCRKVHNVLLLPGLEAADQMAESLEKIGNIHSDGRPILGLDCHDLLEMLLENCPRGMLVPAHIWTPHFALYQLTDQVLFQLLGGNSAELSVNSLYPGCTKFTFGVSFGLELRCHCQRKEQGTYAQKGSYFHSL